MTHAAAAKLVLTLSLSLIVCATTVSAQAIGGRPAYPRADNPRSQSVFVHTLEPGATVQEGIVVINPTQETKRIAVYPVDSVRSTGGSFACAQRGAEITGVGTWIKMEQQEVILETNKKTTVGFTITVPQHIESGEHNGCIVIQEIKEPSKAEGISIALRTARRVIITVPGSIKRELETPSLVLEDTKTKETITIKSSIANSGNASIDTNVTAKTKNIFGRVVEESGGEFPILREDTKDFMFEHKRPFWGGWYWSEIEYTYESGDFGVGEGDGNLNKMLAAKPVLFFIAPHPYALGIYGTGLLLVIGIFVIFRRRKRWTYEMYTVTEGDNIQNLAEKFNVSWKHIVRVNKLKSPYILQEGTSLKIPVEEVTKK